MAFVLSDRIKETTTTTSTGTYTLGGAVSGFETFTANLSNGDTTYYCCTDGTDFEVGLGTFTSSGTTLARTTIISSSNSNNAVSWSSGSRDIFCTLPGSKALSLDGSDDLTLVGANGNIVFDKSDDSLNLGDDMSLKIGDGGDLRISHSAGSGVIRNATDGRIYLQSDNTVDGVIITKELASETMAKFRADGPVELYHNNSKKLETTSAGATVTGTLAATLSTAAQPNITSLGTLTGLTTSGTITLSGTTSPFIKTTGFHAAADRTILQVNAQSTQIGEFGFDIKYMGSRSGNNNSYSLFMHNQTGTDVEAMTVLQDGKVGINNTSPSAPLDVSGDAEITGTLTAGEVSATTLDIGGTNITATATELNYVDVTTLGTVEASKAVTADSSGNVSFPDSGQIRFGASNDLYITHTGSASQFVNQSVGDIQITNGANDRDVQIRTDDGSGSTAIYINCDGSTGEVQLNHYGTEKIKTTSDGAKVSGDLLIESTDGGSTQDPDLILFRNSSSPADFDNIGQIFFRARNDNSQDVEYAKIYSQVVDASDSSEDAYLRFFAKVGGNDQEHFRIGFATTDFFGRVRLTGNSVFSNPVIIFEGSTANSHETTLAVTDPSQDNTVTLPDATGTVLTTGNSDTPTTTTSSSDADFVLVDDGGTMKKITPSNLGITGGGASKGFAVAMAIAL